MSQFYGDIACFYINLIFSYILLDIEKKLCYKVLFFTMYQNGNLSMRIWHVDHVRVIMQGLIFTCRRNTNWQHYMLNITINESIVIRNIWNIVIKGETAHNYMSNISSLNFCHTVWKHRINNSMYSVFSFARDFN